MATIENPPAFPMACLNDPGHPESVPGMTLRDWFAGQAMIAFAKYGPQGHAPAHLIAAASYEAADAMLAARALTPDGCELFAAHTGGAA